MSPQEMYEMISKAELPALQSYQARDQSQLYYRQYHADSNWVIILLHGVAEDGKYLFRFAKYLSSNNLAKVYTPDLRGYGLYPKRRGDVDYLGQIEDDLADFIHLVRKANSHAKIVLAGHSFGGATVLRFAGGRYSNQVDAYLFLAPFIHPNAPTIRKSDKGGHTQVSLLKLILLSLFERIRVRLFHYWKVLIVNKPAEVRHGTETLQLSYRLVMSRFPSNYHASINSIAKPALVLVGEGDELFYAEKFEPLYANNPHIQTKMIPNYNHDGILFGSKTYEEVGEWLENLI